MLIQENLYPNELSEELQIQDKVILLYFINKMDIPLSNSQISQFAIEQDFMNYYSVQQYLVEMEKSNYIDRTQESNTTRYSITEEGSSILNFFSKNLPHTTKSKIIKYVCENIKIVKQDFEIIANHFFDHKTNEYVVKCGVYDDDMMLMELSISVVSKEQALSICNNWRANVDVLYGRVLDVLMNKDKKKIVKDFNDEKLLG